MAGRASGRIVEEARPFMDGNITRYDGPERPTVAERQFDPDSAAIKKEIVVITVLLCFATALERMTFYSIQANLQRIVGSHTDSDISYISYFFAASLFLPLVGGCVGENFLGEFRSSLLGVGLELVSSLVLLQWLPLVNSTPGPFPDIPNSNKVALIVGLVLMTVGVSLSRTNLMILTCKQLPISRLADTSFFLVFFWSVNLGTVLGYTMAGTFNDSLIMCMWSVPLFFSLVLLITARLVPNFEADRPSTLASKIALKSLITCFRRSRPLPDNSMINSVTAATLIRRNRNEKRLCKHLGSIFFLTALHIVFEAVYSFDTMWIDQIDLTQSMSTWLTNDYDSMWAIAVFNPIAVVLVAPIVYFVLLPICRRRSPQCLDQLRSMGLGMVFLILLGILTATMYLNQSPTTFGPVYQTLLYLLISLSEIFTYPIAYEFIYFETPKGLRNSMMGLFFSTLGLGMFLSYGLLGLVTVLASETYHLHFGYFILASAFLQLITIVPYALLAREYRYKIDYTENVDEAINEERRWRCTTFGSTLMESLDN